MPSWYTSHARRSAPALKSPAPWSLYRLAPSRRGAVASTAGAASTDSSVTTKLTPAVPFAASASGAGGSAVASHSRKDGLAATRRLSPALACMTAFSTASHAVPSPMTKVAGGTSVISIMSPIISALTVTFEPSLATTRLGSGCRAASPGEARTRTYSPPPSTCLVANDSSVTVSSTAYSAPKGARRRRRRTTALEPGCMACSATSSPLHGPEPLHTT
mmetsp:Transcript_1917/g.6690  ORF Transcript_1917/g.6690 Transcript_1917/m.6690 type:complete len:218 (+) Transcript_1917:911-1564(+)